MIAQTPPMGWNSWDCYGAAVDGREAADDGRDDGDAWEA